MATNARSRNVPERTNQYRFINDVFHHPVLRNLKITNDFLTFGAVEKVKQEISLTKEITLDSRIIAPDSEWFYDQTEKVPVSGFINEYFKSWHTLNAIGEKLKVKENLLSFEMVKPIMVMEKTLKEFGKSVKTLGEHLYTLENSDLNMYKGMPLKRIGLRLRKMDDSFKKKTGSFKRLSKSLESIGNIFPCARPLTTNLNQDPVIFQIIHSSLYFLDESLNSRIASALKEWADDSVDVFEEITLHLKEIQDILGKHVDSPFDIS